MLGNGNGHRKVTRQRPEDLLKSGQPTQNEAFVASELGAGRYRLDIAGLAKGSWVMKLTIGDAANTAEYTFVVSP